MEQYNQNLGFVGLNKGSYSSSKACLLHDGSVLIASSILTEPGTVSLIKLLPDMKLSWEKKLTNHSLNYWKKHFQHKSTITISDFQILNDKCYVYAIREQEGIYNPVIISTDLQGNLLGYQSVAYQVSSHTPPKGILMNDYAFFLWYDDVEKTVNLDKLLLQNQKISDKKFVYLIQDSLRITSITCNPKSNTVFATTYDPYKGSTLLTYHELDGFRIMSDTNKYQALKLVTSIDAKLYVVATKDSSLVVGMIHPDREPDKILSCDIPTADYTPRFFLVKDSTFYIGIDEINTSQPDFGIDVYIQKYRPNNSKIGELQIRGKYSETLNQLLFCPDGDLLAIGNSESHKSGMGSRVFATKFKL